MRFLVFHSRTGAAALAAALRYAGIADESDYLYRLNGLPAQRRWLLCHQTGEETILAAASGSEPRVLEQALRCVTARFAPSSEVLLFRCHEPRHLRWLFRLRRRRLLPAWVQQSVGRELWQVAFFEREGSAR